MKLILQNIPNKVPHFNTHIEISSDWFSISKADFSTLRWCKTVLSYAKHALALNLKRFRQIDNEQYNSHTDPCTVCVRILYHHYLNATLSFDYHVDCQIHQRNYLNLFFGSYPSVESRCRSMLSNISLVMEFLGNVFTNFIFEKLLSLEALVRGSYSTSNNQTQLFKYL